MTVAHTSQLGYEKATRTGKATSQLKQIVDSLANSVPVTRRQICELTGLPINVVTARVNVVLEDKTLRDGLTKPDKLTGRRDPAFIKVAYEEIDPGTGFEAEFLERIVPQPFQRRIVWPK